MQLSDYLSSQGISATQFAKKVGLKSHMCVYRYMSGENVPSRSIMTRIIRATGGLVTPNDFYGLTYTLPPDKGDGRKRQPPPSGAKPRLRAKP